MFGISDKVWGLVRDGLKAAGGLLVGFGLAEASDVNALVSNVEVLVGAVMTIVGVIASVYAKWGTVRVKAK